ncbi:hypothetical protein D3C87_140590 [compost metagenome]
MKINLSKHTLIFYSILAPFIIFGSIYNLLGIISGTSTVISFGAFALFGFVLLPALLVSTYRQNRCTISDDRISIGKKDYVFNSYAVSIVEKYLPIKERPLFSLFRKQYANLIIREKSSGQIVLNKDLDISVQTIKKMKAFLSV